MQPRAHWWSSFCARMRSTPRGAMRRSYSWRGVRDSIFIPDLAGGTLERLGEQAPDALAQWRGQGERQLLPHARGQVEAVLLSLERRHARRPAQHVLVVERHRLGSPLLLEMERPGPPLASPPVEPSPPA